MSSHILIAKAHGKGGRCALSPQGEAEVLRRLATGESKVKIADDMGVHRNTVANIESRHASDEKPSETPGSNKPRGDSSPVAKATGKIIAEGGEK